MFELLDLIKIYHNIYGPYGTWDGGHEKASVERELVLRLAGTPLLHARLWYRPGGGEYCHDIVDNRVPEVRMKAEGTNVEFARCFCV
jgi:hypothetical protein